MCFTKGMTIKGMIFSSRGNNRISFIKFKLICYSFYTYVYIIKGQSALTEKLLSKAKYAGHCIHLCLFSGLISYLLCTFYFLDRVI